MTALARYMLAGLGASQRYLPPALLFVISVVALTSGGGASLVPSYSAGALAQFICMTWLTVVLVNAEDPVQRAMTTVAAQGSFRVLFANVWAAVLVSVTLMVFGLAYPIAVGAHPVTASAVVVGVVAQLTGGLSGNRYRSAVFPARNSTFGLCTLRSFRNGPRGTSRSVGAPDQSDAADPVKRPRDQ